MVRVHHSMEHMATGVGGWPLNCIGNLESEKERSGNVAIL